MIKAIFWFWLLILLIVSVIPMGTNENNALNTSRVVLRLDHLIHLATFVFFSWIHLLGLVVYKPVFATNSTIKTALILAPAAILFEGLQKYLPYRSFNSKDLGFNLFGAIFTIGIVMFFNFASRNKQDKVKVY